MKQGKVLFPSSCSCRCLIILKCIISNAKTEILISSHNHTQMENFGLLTFCHYLFILSVADLFYIISTCKIVLGTFTTTTTTTTTTPWVSRYQKGKTSLNLYDAGDDGVLGWQWHQLELLDDMQTNCTSLQTDNHTNTTSLNFYRPDALHDAQRTVSKH